MHNESQFIKMHDKLLVKTMLYGRAL